MKRCAGAFAAAVLTASGAGLAGNACALERAASSLPGPDWVAVDTATLDGMRGGYRMPSGLVLSFGIERVAYVNGELVSRLQVSVPDIANITPAQAQELSGLARTQLVQVGSGNVFHGPGNGGLVIQNSLDGQSIRTQTTLDISVNTLGLYQALNAGEALRNASLFATGGP